MKSVITWWQGIPRPARVLCNVLLIAVLAGLVWLFRDCPSLTVEQAYRRAAVSEMIEPGEIVGCVELDLGDFFYDRLLMAESTEGVMLFYYKEAGFTRFDNDWSTKLVYRDKGECVTLMVLSPTPLMPESWKIDIPIILFDEVPKAVRAELDLHLTVEQYNLDKTYEYHLEARRKQGGYFEFHLMAGNEETQLGTEAYALQNLCELYDYDSNSVAGYPAAVRLYDSRDELIYEEEMILRSLAAAAHANEN